MPARSAIAPAGSPSGHGSTCSNRWAPSLTRTCSRRRGCRRAAATRAPWSSLDLRDSGHSPRPLATAAAYRLNHSDRVTTAHPPGFETAAEPCVIARKEAEICAWSGCSKRAATLGSRQGLTPPAIREPSGKRAGTSPGKRPCSRCPRAPRVRYVSSNDNHYRIQLVRDRPRRDPEVCRHSAPGRNRPRDSWPDTDRGWWNRPGRRRVAVRGRPRRATTMVASAVILGVSSVRG
jgi:hypothetical protein